MCIKYSPLWKRVIAWVESSCPSDCGKVWGDVGYCHCIQRPPKQSHNRLDNYSRPRPSLIFKVGHINLTCFANNFSSRTAFSIDHIHIFSIELEYLTRKASSSTGILFKKFACGKIPVLKACVQASFRSMPRMPIWSILWQKRMYSCTRISHIDTANLFVLTIQPLHDVQILLSCPHTFLIKVQEGSKIILLPVNEGCVFKCIFLTHLLCT